MSFTRGLEYNNFNNKDEKPFIHKGFKSQFIHYYYSSSYYPDKYPDLHTLYFTQVISEAEKQSFRLPAIFPVHNLRLSK